MAGENMDWEAIGRAIARGMAAAGNSSGFSSENPTGAQQDPKFKSNIQKQRDKAAEKELKEKQRLTKLEKERQKLLKQTSKIEKESAKVMKDYNAVTKQAGVLQGKQVRELRAQYSSLGSEIGKLEAKLAAGNLTKEEEIKLTKDLNNTRKEQIQVANKAIKSNRQNSERWGTAVTALGGAALAVANAFKTDIMTQLANASQLGVLTTQKFTAQLGTSTEQLTRLEASNRRAFNAMGGTEEGLTTLTNHLQFMDQELVKSVGGWTETTEYFAKSITQLTNAGIRPSAATFDQFTGQMMDFRRIFGVTADQYVQLNEQLANNADIRYALQGLNEQERRAKLEAIRTQFKLNGVMGMSAEQAMKAAEALAEIGGQKAESRIKQAARLRAMGAALGVGGAEEAAQAVMAGEGRATPEQKAALQGFLSQVSNMGAQVRGPGGSLGQEMMFQRLTEGLQFDKIIGKGSPFNTRLNEAAQLQLDAALDVSGKFGTLAEKATGTEKAMVDLSVEAQRVENVFMDKFAASIGTAIGKLGIFSTALLAASKTGILGSVLGGGGGATARGGIGALAKGLVARLPLVAAATGIAASGTAAWKSMDWWSADTPEEQKKAANNVGSYVDTMLSAVGLGGVTGADERLELMANQSEQQSKSMDKVASLSEQQAQEAMTSNDLIRQLININKAQLEAVGGTEALQRLNDIDAMAQPTGTYGNR